MVGFGGRAAVGEVDGQDAGLKSQASYFAAELERKGRKWIGGQGLNSASRWSGAERNGQAEMIGENEGVRDPDCCVPVCDG